MKSPLSPTSTARSLAVVTGASSGIGYELARIFAENGYDLVIAAEDDGINKAARDFEELGSSVIPVKVDLADPDGPPELYARIRSLDRPVAAVCFNAGVGVGGDFVRQTNLAEEINMINLNVTSTVHLAKLVLRDMVRNGEGRALFTASVASTMPTPFEAVYGATKAFVMSFAESLRSELKDTGVSVTALMPGPTETNFFHRAGLDDTRVGAAKKDDPAKVARDGFDAMMKGDDSKIGGSVKSKAMGMMNEVMPETAKAAMHRHLAEPGSANKH